MNKLKILFSSYLIFLTLIGCGKNEETEINVGGSGSGTITGTTAKLDVEKAGTLTNLIPKDKKYTITNLVLSGELNGTDIKFIREMAGCDVDGETTAGKLSNLDLTDINIVTGGEPYYVLSSSSTYNSQKNTITSYMFYKCNSLNHIKLPNSITSIEDDAFKECTTITSITIGNGVTSVEGYAFYGCTELKEVIVDSNNTTYSSSDGILFNKEQTTLIKCPEGKTGEYTIPNNITSIEASAFSRCTKLTSIRISNSITGIEAETFNGCTRLTSITIPNSVTSIGNYAFNECTGLTSVTLEDGNTELNFSHNSNSSNYDSDIFVNCPIQELYLGRNISYYSYYSPFKNKTTITNITIGNSVTKIGSGAFEGCTGFTSITIPNSVTNIGSEAFYGCTGLTSITIPDGVTNIGSSAFSGCTGLTSITIPNGVTKIDESAFSGCTGLTSVTIGNSVTSIGGLAFVGCTGLIEIHCLAKTPPSTQFGYTFYGIKAECKLYVPIGCSEAYKTAGEWAGFKNIIEE